MLKTHFPSVLPFHPPRKIREIKSIMRRIRISLLGPFPLLCSKRILFISLRNIKVSSFLLGIHLTHSHFHDSSSKRSGKDFRSTDCSFHLTPLSMVQWKFHPFSFSLIFWQRCETFLWQQNMNTEKARRKSFAMFPRSGIRIDADSHSHFCRFTAAACSLFSVFTMR